MSTQGITLHDLAREPGLVSRAPFDVLPELLGELKVLEARILMRLNQPSPDTSPDRLLTAKEAAAILSTSVHTLYANKDRLPFAVRTFRSRQIRFSEHGIQRFLKERAGRP